MANSGRIFSIFSNLWFYIGSGNTSNDTDSLIKIKQIHGITKTINLDSKTGFWPNTIARYDQYDPTIAAQLQLRNCEQLTEQYKSLSNMITTIITKPSSITSSGKTKDHNVLIYTLNPRNIECLLGLYIYFLCTKTGIDLKTATEILKTKIQINTSTHIFTFSDYMKKYLYIKCTTQR